MKINYPGLSKWKENVISDLKNKEFMPIKGLFFLIFGANVALIPFLTLQARSLGITEEEVGIIYSFIPIASLVAPPLSGMLADKIGNFKVLLSGVTALAGLAGLLFMLVPVGRARHTLPDQLPLEITCSASLGSNLKAAYPYECIPSTKYESFSIDILNCSFTCTDMTYSANEDGGSSINPNLQCGNSTVCIKSISSLEISSQPKTNISDIREETLDEFTETKAVIYATKSKSSHSVQYTTDDVLCPFLYKIPEDDQNCFTTCKAETIRSKMCSNRKSIQEFNPSVTFYSHLVIRVFNEFTIATSMPLLEGAAVTILKEHQGDFGLQRLYCNIGMMIMTPISGSLIDYFSKIHGFEDFRPSMIMYCCLKIIAAFVMLFLNMKFKQASTKVVSGFSALFLNPEIVCFLLATFLAGTCYGYIETFLFWLLEDLGADKQLMGITLTVGSIFGIPLLMVSTAVMKKIGHVNTIVLGFAVYILRLFGYTVINSPWWAMPFEALECFTVSLMVVAFVSYAAVLASPSTVVTLQGLYGGLYNGVGRGAGSLIGGFLIENVGIFPTFRIIAAIGGASGLSYWIVNFIFFRKKNMNRKVDIEKKRMEDIDIGNAEKLDKKMTDDRDTISTFTKSDRKNRLNVEIVQKESNISGVENKAFENDTHKIV